MRKKGSEATPGNLGIKQKLKQKGKQAMMKRNEEGHEKGRVWRIFFPTYLID